MHHALVVYHGIFHLSLLWSRYIHWPKGFCVYRGQVCIQVTRAIFNDIPLDSIAQLDCVFQQLILNAVITFCLPARVLRHTSMFPVSSLAVHRHVESHRWRTRRESNWTMAAQYPGLFSQFFMDALSLTLPSVLTEHLVSVFVLTMLAQGFHGRRCLDVILGMVKMDYRMFCIFLWYTYFIGKSIRIHYIYFYATLYYIISDTKPANQVRKP